MMKRWIGLALLVFVGTAGWRIGESLSSDALSMAVGVLFGVMAGVPTALLVMAGNRRRSSDDRAAEHNQRQQQGPLTPMHPHMNGWAMPYAQPSYAQQPPIVVIAGPQGFGRALQPAESNGAWFPQDPPARQFTVVGEREEFLEEW
jgi:hypothetical protein